MAKDTRRLLFLLVDDEPMITKAYQRVIDQRIARNSCIADPRISVMRQTSPENALAVLAECEKDYAAVFVISDLEMGGRMSGTAFIEKLRKLFGDRIKFERIVTGAIHLPLEEAKRLDIEVCHKPMSASSLQSCIDEFLALLRE